MTTTTSSTTSSTTAGATGSADPARAGSADGCASAHIDLVPVGQILTDTSGVVDRIEVLGEPTAVAELVIIPARDCGGRFRGSFSLTHAPSGYAVARDVDPYLLGERRASVAELRELADELAALNLDWAWTDPATAPHDCLTRAGAAVRAWRRRAGREDDES